MVAAANGYPMSVLVQLNKEKTYYWQISVLYLRTNHSLPHLHILIEMMRCLACLLECVSQCGRGSLLTWLTHLPWLTNIKRANHINLLSTDSDVNSTQRVPRLLMLIDLQTEVQTKHPCLGGSRPKQHRAVHCTSVDNIKEWNLLCQGQNLFERPTGILSLRIEIFICRLHEL